MECYTISKRDLFISEVRVRTSNIMCIPYFPLYIFKLCRIGI